jgi:GNAT superfamily N-acetyltransferase
MQTRFQTPDRCDDYGKTRPQSPWRKTHTRSPAPCVRCGRPGNRGRGSGGVHPALVAERRHTALSAYQGQGIGAALLGDTLRALWRMRAEHVTLNTQSDNRYSQRLYRRFGFEMTGDYATVWELRLE